MPPIYDFDCKNCGTRHESLADYLEMMRQCPKCQHMAERIISIGKVNTANEDAAWLKTVTDVVDKDGGPVHQEFIRNPTRENYRRWMKETGLRHLEPGEGPIRPHVDEAKIEREVMEKHRKRERIEL